MKCMWGRLGNKIIIYCVRKYIFPLMFPVWSDSERITLMFVFSDVDPGGGDLLYWTAGRHHHGSHTERERRLVKYISLCQFSYLDML